MQNGNEASRSLHFRTCNLCEAMCGLEIEHAGGEIFAIRGDDDDPFSRGHICPKAVAMQDVYFDPDRLKRPVARDGDAWREISWNDAFSRVTEGFSRVREEFGADANALYYGNPNVHNLGSMLVGQTLRRAFGSKNLYSATSVDQLPHHVAARAMFGHYLLLPIPDVDHTDYFLILGANPIASNGSILTAPGIGRRIQAIRKRGGKVVAIDPRRTETGESVDEHHFIPPGRDILLLLSMVHVLFAEDLVEPGRLEEMTKGIDAIAKVAADFSPDKVAAALHIEAETIRRLTREFAAAPGAVCYGRMGLSTQAFGGLCQWVIQVINVLTGNLDRTGGSMFTTPAVDIVTRDRAGKSGRWASRVRGIPEFFGELPSSVLVEEMTTPGDGQIRGLLTIAGNPVLSTPNGRGLDQAMAKLDFVAAIDIYINETTRHADVILPPTTGLECSHYDVVFHVLAARNTAKWSEPLFKTGDDRRHDWQIFRELAARLATDDRPFDANDPRHRATPEQMIDHGLKTGPYGHRGLSLELLREEPHGFDLGPLEPRLPERLFTDDNKIDLAPAEFLEDLARVHSLLESPPLEGGLVLIGRRDLRTNNSWMHNSERLVKGPKRCTLLIHPDDAASRGVTDGDLVVVRSRVGKVELPAQVRDSVMPGVVSIPHGWGHDHPGVRLTVAKEHAGVSINDLTDGELIDPLTGNAALSGVPVEIERTG